MVHCVRDFHLILGTYKILECKIRWTQFLFEYENYGNYIYIVMNSFFEFQQFIT